METLIVAAMATAILAVVAKILFSNVTFFKRMAVRQMVNQDSRVGLERIQQMIRKGRAETLVISTPAGSTVPNSKVNFELQTPLPNGTTAYSVYLDPVTHTVYGNNFIQAPQVLAKNVTALIFTGNSMDPAVVSVSLQIDAFWDDTKDLSRSSSILIPNYRVQMVESL